MNLKSSHKEALIKAEASRLGFDACGIARLEKVLDESYFKHWLEEGYAAEMGYMHNHLEKRLDPRLLVEGSKSIIVVALNYYPQKFQNPENPQFSYYAYGQDYHDVIKEKLKQLYTYIQEHFGEVSGRLFTDSAPVLERYWAVKAGLGFIGKNTQLIMPRKGSYFFLGELIIDLELTPDKPLSLNCGSCRKCLDACPPQALISSRCLDANKCISYQTIENKGEIAENTKQALGNHVYGCDVCQQVCPWNRFATPNQTPEFYPSADFIALDYDQLRSMTEDEFRILFRKSAVKRAGYKGLMRNIDALKKIENNQMII